MAQGQPIFILPEGTNRSVGRDAQRNNILAGKVLAETVRTTLGPKGMDKMLVNSLGDVTVTNDGATIMREMDIAQPAARMLVETAKKQENAQEGHECFRVIDLEMTPDKLSQYINDIDVSQDLQFCALMIQYKNKINRCVYGTGWLGSAVKIAGTTMFADFSGVEPALSGSDGDDWSSDCTKSIKNSAGSIPD